MRATPRPLAALVLVVMVGGAGWWACASAEDAPPPPPAPPLERLFQPLKEEMKDLPPFLGDADLRAHFRTYYFNRTKPDDTVNEALAFGGWIGLRSGWFLDTFSLGATLYGSAPLHAPDDRDGTLLLKPGQEGYYVPGEAWAAFRYKDYALLKGYRQLVDVGYVNPQDNRMTPNTFEGVTVSGKLPWFEYVAGYVWEIKTRNADEFVSMSSAAGVRGEHDGVALAGIRLTPAPGLRIDLNDAWGDNMFNTLYGEVEYLHSLNEDWKVRIGAQFTDQRAVGDARVQTSDERHWATQVGGVRTQLIYRELTLTGAFSVTSSGNTIQNPWGSYPGYISLIDQDFNRAREKAVLVGVAYDFSKLGARGLSAYTNVAWGWDAIDPMTREDAPRQTEYDLTVDYRPPWLLPAFLKGLWFRARAAVLDQEDARRTGYQFRLILNWERDLL
ncbi:MAG TPA: OprD family outer membrane porin [Candidatus Polarisedimenticolia bacterium]|nr:OprD family outer membrane porin [Candidatus Polarisedimenticolia bacterium]